MPTPQLILEGLTFIANRYENLAIVWHFYFAVIVLGLAFRANLRKPTFGVLVALPLLNVSLAAWKTGNPFNGVLFAAAGVALIALAARLPRERVRTGPVWAVVVGALLFLFGWVYPHFLDTTSWVRYLYAAPTGLVPCPTLAIVTGLALIAGGLGSRAWTIVLAVMGLFYGFFGAVRLGVALDWVLVAGAVVLLVGFGGRRLARMGR